MPYAFGPGLHLIGQLPGQDPVTDCASASAPVSGTGTGGVFLANLDLPTSASNQLPGAFSLFARVTDGPHSRYLAASQPVIIGASRLAPVLRQARFATNRFTLTVSGFPGPRVVIEASTNLAGWFPVATNTVKSRPLDFTDPQSAVQPHRCYRALLAPQ